MAEQDLNRSESATPFKLQKAREQGSVAKSADFNAVVMMTVAVVAAYGLAPGMLMQLAHEATVLLDGAGRIQWSVAVTASITEALVHAMLVILGPLFLGLVVAAVLANLLQSGPGLSVKALAPDFRRLNPAEGLKKLLSLRSVYELAKSVLKFAVLGAVAGLALVSAASKSLGLATADPRSLLGTGLHMGSGLLTKLTLALFALALIDVIYTRWDFGKRMRMSQRDLTQESKEREGDPRIRTRMRDLRQAMLKRSRAARQLKSADVLVTNPTHLAVAISYARGGAGDAPVLVAKGAGDTARTMRAFAGLHRIPIFENPRVARALFREVEVDSPIPPHWYPDVARMLVWAFARRDMLQTRAGVTA